jgi:hypothetical protein
MLFVWVKYDNEYEPHMVFGDDEKQEARFEVRDLRDKGYQVRFRHMADDTSGLLPEGW